MWLGLALNRQSPGRPTSGQLGHAQRNHVLHGSVTGHLTQGISINSEWIAFPTLVRVEADKELHVIKSCIYYVRKKNFSLIKFLWELKIKWFLQRNYEVLSSHYFLLLVYYLLFTPTFLFGTSSPLPWSQASGKNFRGIRASGNVLFAFWFRSLPFLIISSLNQTIRVWQFLLLSSRNNRSIFLPLFLVSFLLKGTISEFPPISGLFGPSGVAKSSPHPVNFANTLTFLPFQCHYKHSNCLRLHCFSK